MARGEMTRTCLGYQKGSLYTLITPVSLSLSLLLKDTFHKQQNELEQKKTQVCMNVRIYIHTCALLVQLLQDRITLICF